MGEVTSITNGKLDTAFILQTAGMFENGDSINHWKDSVCCEMRGKEPNTNNGTCVSPNSFDSTKVGVKHSRMKRQSPVQKCSMPWVGCIDKLNQESSTTWGRKPRARKPWKSVKNWMCGKFNKDSTIEIDSTIYENGLYDVKMLYKTV